MFLFSSFFYSLPRPPHIPLTLVSKSILIWWNYQNIIIIIIIRVLNVISRWVKLQYQDFKKTPVLQTRLETFINGDIKRAGFTTEASMIKDALDLQVFLFNRK